MCGRPCFGRKCSGEKMAVNVHLGTLVLILTCLPFTWASDSEDSETYSITGKIQIRNTQDISWLSETRVVADGGKYTGYLRKDGSFSINGVPSGTYIVEVYSSNYEFNPVRVDINKNGKIRARKVNFLKMSAVDKLPYPLTFSTGGQATFFAVKQGWNIISMITNNPMILYLVAPLLILFILPKLMGGLDPESQKDVQETMSALTQKGGMPSMEEWVTNFFSGGKKPPAKKSAKPLPASSTGGARRSRK